MIKILVSIIFFICLTACGDSNNPNSSNIIPQVTITFHKNDGSDDKKTQTVQESTQVNLIKNTFTRFEYEFKGWSTSSTGEVEYEDEAVYLAGTSNIDLYAVWEMLLVIEIYTVDELNEVRNNLSGNYKLMTNISLETFSNWVPIGSMSEPFTGTFNGNNYKITNLNIDRPREDCIGLFGAIHDAEIMDLGLEEINITGVISGGIVGYASNSTITNSYSLGIIGSTDRFSSSSGGIAGIIENSTIINSYSLGNILGSLCGGIAAIVNDSVIINCYSTGDVGYESSFFSGGIIGEANDSTITNCYSTGDITAFTYVGGIAAIVDNCIITECYSAGDITGTYAFYCSGGIVGYSSNSIIKYCHSTGNISASYSGGIVGAATNSIITNCYSTGDVFSVLNEAHVGGIIGIMIDSIIMNCYSTGDILGSSAGGIVGWMTNQIPFEMNPKPPSGNGVIGIIENNKIMNCYNTGDVSAFGWAYWLGGIAAIVGSGTIINCYSSGNIFVLRDDIAWAGGIAGYVDGGVITNCAALNPDINTGGWVGRIVGENPRDILTIYNNFALETMTDSGIVKFDDTDTRLHGISKTDVELKMQSTYSNSVDDDDLGGLGWKFGNDDDNPWKMPIGEGYPILYWQ